MISIDMYYREEENKLLLSVFKNKKLIAIATVITSSHEDPEKEFVWKQGISFYGDKTDHYDSLVTGDSWTTVLKNTLDEVLRLANLSAPQDEQSGIQERLTDIYELAQTDLPITGYTLDEWNKHRIRRIEGMARLTLEKLEKPEKEVADG